VRTPGLRKCRPIYNFTTDQVKVDDEFDRRLKASAKRLECALAVCSDLAGAFAARVVDPSNGISNPKSGSKLRALQTPRATLCTCHIDNSPRARRKVVQTIFDLFLFFSLAIGLDF
jgi:hypothetical protein